MLKYTAISLGMALASAAPLAHALDGTAGSSHSVGSRMRAETPKASDPDAPAPLPVPSDISLAELERRLALGQAQAAEKHHTSALDPAVLSSLAQQMGCLDIVGAQPFGFPLDQAQPTILSGAHLLARCPERAYVTITAMSMAGKAGKRASISLQSFNQTVDGRPARRLYYKAPNGRQRESLTIIDGSYAFALEYWSLDDSQQGGMVGTRRMETLTLPR
ncbi:hypothetical protein SAMN05216517_101294 [Janthinobacterium sp. OK676]|uniref:hypothetical protein n=1 Tax=unclassified Janthinobacterium TaxID=2610881 RepID=UPI00088865CE|nr:MULTISPECIES: hypothetical protein [unclassified Janthinobacterium]PJJ17957.1 hypothetical protein CLU90_1138 [Janthinobacterium sp. 67]SDL49391.1 hypothetical protein SAMN05216517_101294 [Janthinobacterium sp. OK676]